MPPMGVEANLEMGYTEEGGTDTEVSACTVRRLPRSPYPRPVPVTTAA